MRKTLLLIALALAAWLQLLTVAHGQSAKPSAEAAIEPSERARREGANPMRLILEAGKIKRKGPDAEPAAAGVAVSAARVPVAPVAAVLAPPPAPPRRVVAEVAEQTTTLLMLLLTPPAQTAALLTPANGPLADAGMAAAALAPMSFSPLPAPPQETSIPVALAAPRLLSQVAPEFPESLMRRVRSFNDLLVQITVNRDGSVSDISIVTPGYRSLEPFVIEALQKWRYEAQEQPRTQQLRLVFNEQR